MNEPIVQAKRNLLFNGDFSEGTQGWKKSGLSIGISEDWYAWDRIMLLHLSHQSAVSQELEVPRKTASDAQYRLSFLCETIHQQSGWLRLFKGPEEILTVELKPAIGRNHEQDLARLAAGQPLEFVPIEYEQALTSPLNAGDTLRIEIKSPPNADGDYGSKVRIARINLQLHLDPLKLRTMKLDDQVLDEDTTLYFCLGATGDNPHCLTFEPEPENAWENTEAALTLIDNPQQAIIVKPGPAVEQLLTGQWSLDCPVVGDEGYSFTLNLINRYNAEPYTIPVSLGHHRLKFRDRLEAAFYPVLEYQQRVRLGVQVASFYTHQSVAGLTVNWSTAERVTAAAVSDEYGWAYFDFEPAKAGEAVIEASVESPYYASGVYTEQFKVRVLDTDPWKDLRAVVEEVETAWDAQGYPNRGSSHDLRVRLPVDSPLLETELSLHWRGDSHQQLGVDVSPPLEQWVQVTQPEMRWTLTCDDELDGRFLLSLVCSKLLLPSLGKPMSLARNRVRIDKIHKANKFPVVDEQESVLLRVQVVHETAFADGEPVRNALVEWCTPEGVITAYSGYGGWASLFYTPSTAGDSKVMAQVKAHPQAVPVTQEFEVRAIATSPWKTEVEIRLDEEIVKRNTLGLVCTKGVEHTLRVTPVAGSSWIGEGISLQWRDDDHENIGLEVSEPGVSKPLTAQGVQWTLSSAAQGSTSSLFELELRLQSVEIVRELSGRLLSADLSSEVSLLLDQIRAAPDEQALYPCLGAIHCFNVLPNALSPLVGLQAELSWSGEPIDELGASVRPALETSQPLSDGGAIWELDFSASEQPGRFALTLALPELDYVAEAKPMVLGHNKVKLHAVREAAVDPVVGQAPAWLSVQVYSHFTDRPVGQVPVKWWDGSNGGTISTDLEGWSHFDFRPNTGGMHSVTALVESYFDDFADSRTIAVKSQQTDPWAGLMVSFDNKPAQLWGEKTCFPRRKGQHRIDVKAAANSTLLDGGLALGMTGAGPTELGIRFEDAVLGEFRRFTEEGLTFHYSVGDLKNGRFGLCFASERLASLSPVNAMSLGEGAQVVKIAERSRVSQTLLWGEALCEQITIVSAISGRPMAGVSVVWSSRDLGQVTTSTNFHGVARFCFVPTSPGAAQLTATVGDAQYSESISLPFFLNEPRQIKELTSDDLPGYPEQEIRIHATVVSTLTDEPLPDVWVKWEYENVSITPSKTNAQGIAELIFKLPFIRQGVLYASVEGGYAGWDLKSLLVVADVPELNPLIVPGNDVVEVEELTLVYAKVISSVSRKPIEGVEVVWFKNNVEQARRNTTNVRGEAQENFTANATGSMTIEAQIRDPQGEAFDSQEFVFTVIERS